MINSKIPFFSIIIPTYNRANVLPRAVNSCLNQDYHDFEIVIVDDGSTDHTEEIIKGLPDERISYFKHENNMGVCCARNTGTTNSRGQWIIPLDSDNELLPGALEKLSKRVTTASADIGNMASSKLWDTGIITPSPAVPVHEIGYEQYLQWLNKVAIPEYANCFRREVFETSHYPKSRAYETSFHLNVAKKWLIEIGRDPLMIYHTDNKDRITRSSPGKAVKRLLLDAQDCAEDSENIITEHGAALKKWAPKVYVERLTFAAQYFFLSGLKSKGISYSWTAIRSAPWNSRSWMTLALGLLGSRVLAWSKAMKAQYSFR